MAKQIKLGKCQKCGIGFTYMRIKTGERVCRKCGHISKIKVEVKK